MKNLQNHLNESVITDSSYFSQNNQQKQKNNVFCQFNNNVTHVCENKKCTKPAFICEIKDCECKKQHQFCYELKLQSLLKNIQNKQVFVESLETCINDGVQEIIDMLSTYRDETISKMKKDFQFFGLSQNEKEFMKEVKDGKCKNLTGCKIWEIISSEREREKITKMMDQTCKSLKSEFQKSKQFFEQTIKNTKVKIDRLDSQVDQFIMETEIPKYLTQKKSNLIDAKFQPHQSKIMTSQNEFILIGCYFGPRILKSVKLLYQASSNDFDVQKFHGKCDGIPDTLIVVETQFGKKIGGYTPIEWSTSNDGWVSDESMKSFIFSLTEGNKLQLTSKDKAVYHHSDFGPTFGSGYDLYICDKANTSSCSSAYINSSYKNQNYQQGDKQSWLRFVGNGESYVFKVKQWQVWRVEFQ